MTRRQQEIKRDAIIEAADDLTGLVEYVNMPGRRVTPADSLLLLQEATSLAYRQADWIHSYVDLTGDQCEAVKTMAERLYWLNEQAYDLWHDNYIKERQEEEEGHANE